MTELHVTTCTIPAARLGAENPLPMFRHKRQDISVGLADNVPPEERGYFGWRCAYRVLPYRLQDDYDRVKQPRAFKALVLENDKLRATVLPELGGRLVSLEHKASGRELLDRNPVFQPANLALRNAWFSGGVEWNAGQFGHTYMTCSPLFAARIAGPDGEPALRLYEWDRTKRFVYQVDLHLPQGSDFLYVHVRVVNPTAETIAMYWWTNIAVPEAEDVRTLSSADSMFHSSDGKVIEIARMPHHDGVDASYATTMKGAHEYFFRIEQGQRPWVSALDGGGRGLIHTSTARLKGRKAFYWGRNQGGQRWQEFLAETGRSYIEIQAGLATTQVEHVPMPALASWEWTEAFGLMEADPTVAHHADWHTAWTGVDAALERRLPRAELDAIDRRLAACTRAPAVELLHEGSGWGALERRRCAATGEADHLPRELVFERLGAEQEPWLALLERGALPEVDPAAPGALMTQPQWRALLERAVAAGKGDHWAAWWHLGNMRCEDIDHPGARAAWQNSLAKRRTAWALRNLSVLAAREDATGVTLAYRTEEPISQRALALLMDAWQAGPRTIQLAIECMAGLSSASEFQRARDFAAALPPDQRGHERIRIWSANAAMNLNDLTEVERLFDGDFATIREGEVTLTDLWFGMHERRLSGGKPADAALKARVKREFPPPRKIDFRMLADVGSDEAARKAAGGG